MENSSYKVSIMLVDYLLLVLGKYNGIGMVVDYLLLLVS